MEAVILAGGKGTRLAARTNGLPKSLVPICGKPLLEFQLELLARHGIRRATLLCGLGAEAIRAFCGSGSRWGLELTCIDEVAPLGTAGAVIAALDRLPGEFLVLYGDTMVNVDLRRFCAAHTASRAHATLLLHPNDHPWDSDLVETDEQGRVIAIHAYPHSEGAVLPNRVNAALYVMKRSSLAGFEVPIAPLDFAKHVFPQMLARGIHLNGYRSPEYIKDAGTPERLDRVERDLQSGKVAASSLDVRQPAVFLDRDGTINEEIPYLARPELFKLIPGAGQAIRNLRDAGYRIVVVTNQPVISRGECTAADVNRVHDQMEIVLSREGAFVDGIYVCPHHPDKGYQGERAELKFECECRKPNVGMVRQAERELNLDLGRSWMIGDRTGDIQTAHNCGVRSILLRTGMAGRDRRYAAAPDFTFDNLLAASRYIVEQHAGEAEG